MSGNLFAMVPDLTISFRRRHLPHWMVADRPYFVTTRLKHSLPRDVLDELASERDAFLATRPGAEEVNEFDRQRLRRIDAVLDACDTSPAFLADPSVARTVVDGFTWLEREHGWRVYALTVMPNHLHVLLRNLHGENHLLNKHFGRLKGFTARQANLALGRRGAFWEDENFDHWCRSDAEVIETVDYIRKNPVSAGLAKRAEDWPWTRIAADYKAESSSQSQCPLSVGRECLTSLR
jgi:putative transposase